MRRRVGLSCAAAIASVGAATIASAMSACVSASNPSPAASADSGSVTPSDDATLQPALDGGPDVTVVVPGDAGIDAPPDTGAAPAADASDAATPDASGAEEAGCAPIPVSGFVAPAYVPASGSALSACQTTAQLTAQQGLYTACFGAGATSASCDGFDGGEGGATCIACINTNETDPKYGPVVERVVPTINLAGCIQLADPTDAGIACAHAVQAAEACVEAACKSVCPVTDLPSQTAYLACTSAAAAGGCAVYAQAAATCAGAEVGDGGSGPAGSSCFGVDEQSEYAAVAYFFCGS